ncbi:hypothetical protein TNIN_44391 [Trichonephila inaurata madagascariensis]|uniref:Uncharacterized protein n=1 Tax=Trichonephila inaurata madagascariensis TaxID=2747483 RepID=A0A8X7C2D6_9ARAC|nr:hypothetical protein TNIN_44391 [Trichonephila inaurata madagascariensis]
MLTEKDTDINKLNNITILSKGNKLPIDGGTEPLLDVRCEREGVYVVADVRDSKDDPESACVSWKVQWQSGRPDSLSIREYVSDPRGIFVAWTGLLRAITTTGQLSPPLPHFLYVIFYSSSLGQHRRET